MGFELDKHDLFRYGLPGAIFLLVLFSFRTVHLNFDFLQIKPADLKLLLTIIISLPIGYVVYFIYRAWHILEEIDEWEEHEAKQIRPLLQTNGIINSSMDTKHLTYFVEFCLYIKSSVPIRERVYGLITRVHSLGGCITAIVTAMVVLILTSILTGEWKFLSINYWILMVIWEFVIFCFYRARSNAIKGYQVLTEHFVSVNRRLIVNVANNGFDFQVPVS